MHGVHMVEVASGKEGHVLTMPIHGRDSTHELSVKPSPPGSPHHDETSA